MVEAFNYTVHLFNYTFIKHLTKRCSIVFQTFSIFFHSFFLNHMKKNELNLTFAQNKLWKKWLNVMGENV